MIRYLTILYFTCILTRCESRKEEGNTTGLPQQETELKNQVQKFPDSLILRENLIQYYRDNGNYVRAISETENAINRDSSDARLYDIKAILHFENGDTLQAIQSFEKAITLQPSPEYLISLGTLYAQTRNPQALRLAEALLKIDKEKAGKQALFIKGLYYTYNNEKLQAINFFDQALGQNYTFMEAYREKAIALYDLGKYNEALAVLDKAVTLQNNFDEGYYYRGRTLEKLGRKQEAVESYQRALMYDPEYIEAKDALARLGFK